MIWSKNIADENVEGAKGIRQHLRHDYPGVMKIRFTLIRQPRMTKASNIGDIVGEEQSEDEKHYYREQFSLVCSSFKPLEIRRD